MTIKQIMPFPPTGQDRDFYSLYIVQPPNKIDPFRAPCIVGLALVEDDDGETAVEYITMTPNTRALRITSGYYID